ncbi:MAG: hypothetical protein IT198_06220 [Acidimicrobiia bacterium]|nr:hypothetical protein [Acidimicrobiia bacterium]
MVVVLIIAILIAIAIPTFLGARQRAQDRAAQSDIRNAFTAEKTHYTDTEAYTDVGATIDAIEPSLTYQDNSLNPPANTVGLDLGASAQEVCVVKQSNSGQWFGLRDQATGAGSGTTYFSGAAAPGACNAATFALTEW